MIHRRALITGLMASVAAPAMARLAPPANDIFADGRMYFGKGDWVTIASLDIQSEVPLPCGWLTYWDGENICRREVSWDDVYKRDGWMPWA